jgi:hypothetical protein
VSITGPNSDFGPPEMVPVRSGNVLAIGYKNTTGELWVTFRKYPRLAYVYAHVPLWLHGQLMNAASKGSYMKQFVEPKFRFRRVRI